MFLQFIVQTKKECYHAQTPEPEDLDLLREKYLGWKLTRSFKVDGELVTYKGVIDRIFWETELNKYLFHVVYTDGDNEELELLQVRMFVL